MQHNSSPPDPQRRDFVKKACAIAIGGIVSIVPPAAGVVVFLDPLHGHPKLGNFVRVATLGDLPNDGLPRKFTIISSREDAWTRHPQVPIGAIYLRRTSENAVEALNVVCPHAGCFVDFKTDRRVFFCPCHNSSFGIDGRIADPKSPSPRALDALDVEIRNGTEVWVKFQNFRAGHAAKIPA